MNFPNIHFIQEKIEIMLQQHHNIPNIRSTPQSKSLYDGIELNRMSLEYFEKTTNLITKLSSIGRIIPKLELHPRDIATFLDEQYDVYETTEQVSLIRIWGREAEARGRFFSDYFARSKEQAELLSGLHPNWGNSKEFFSVVEIDQGIRVNVGKVAQVKVQGWDGTIRTLGGNVNQYLIENAFELFDCGKIKIIYTGNIF